MVGAPMKFTGTPHPTFFNESDFSPTNGKQFYGTLHIFFLFQHVSFLEESSDVFVNVVHDILDGALAKPTD